LNTRCTFTASEYCDQAAWGQTNELTKLLANAEMHIPITLIANLNAEANTKASAGGDPMVVADIPLEIG